MSHMKVSAQKQFSPLIPEGQADVVVGMEPVETLRILKTFGNQNVITIINPRPIHAVDFTGTGAGYPDLQALIEQVKSLSAKTYLVPATEEAQKMGNAILANMILIGSLIETGLVPIGQDAIEKTIKDMFPKAVKENTEALNKGKALIHKQ